MLLASGATTDWPSLLVLAAILLTVATFATWGADRYDIDWVGHLLSGRMPWTRFVGGVLVMALVTGAGVVALGRAHASAAAPTAAVRPDVQPDAPSVSGLAAPAVPRAGAAAFVASPTLPPTIGASDAAAGGEGRQGAPESGGAAAEATAVPSSAPAGADVPTVVVASGGLALRVPVLGAAGFSHPAVPLPPVADAIAACESGAIDADGNPVLGTYSLTAENPVSSASGKYQAIDGTWIWVTALPPPASAYPEDVQDEFFVDLWDEGRGSSHWDASRWCWAGAA